MSVYHRIARLRLVDREPLYSVVSRLLDEHDAHPIGAAGSDSRDGGVRNPLAAIARAAKKLAGKGDRVDQDGGAQSLAEVPA